MTKTLTKMQIAYGRALIKKAVKDRKKRLAEQRKNYVPPLYDDVYFQAVKWMDENG